MSTREVHERYNRINRLVASQRLKKALEDLGDLITITRLGEYTGTLENLNTTYENMLKYTLEGVDDPDRVKIYDHLRRSIIELNTRIKGRILETDSMMQTSVLKRDFAVRQRLSGIEFVNRLEDLYFYKDIQALLQGDYGLTSPLPGEYRTHHETIRNIFNYFFCCSCRKSSNACNTEDLPCPFRPDNRVRGANSTV